MLTKKGKYGLKAMVHLAGVEPGALAQVTDVAEANSISKKFLDHILSELRHAGLVYSKRGGVAATRLPVRLMKFGSAQSFALLTAHWRRSGALRSLPIGLATTARI